jgi:hypothetical protein
MSEKNDLVVLICGDSATGKTSSLEFLENHEGIMYLNCEGGKRAPFKAGWKPYTITDPYQVERAFEVAETKPEVHTIVIDGLNYLMDMFESVHVINSTNTMQQWGAYAQFLKNLMMQVIAKSTKRVIVLAHIDKQLNEDTMEMTVSVPVKGSMKGKVESFFTTIVYAKRLPLKKIAGYENSMLEITEDDEIDGFKHVFQTRPTKDTVNEKMRAPRRLWKREETFIDNDCNKLLKHLEEFYQ